jgi:hypothetical protein
MMTMKLNFDELTEELKNKIKSLVPNLNPDNVLVTAESKMVFYRKDSGFDFFGCEFCLFNEVRQDEFGDFIIGDLDLLNFFDIQPETDMPQEFGLNLWYCPKCHKQLINQH